MDYVRSRKVASANCIAFGVFTLGIYFDAYVAGIAETSLESAEIANQIGLISGYAVEAVSAIALSRVFRLLLSYKSVRKIPPDNLRSCGKTIRAFFLTLFSWAMISLIGGITRVS